MIHPRISTQQALGVHTVIVAGSLTEGGVWSLEEMLKLSHEEPTAVTHCHLVAYVLKETVLNSLHMKGTQGILSQC